VSRLRIAVIGAGHLGTIHARLLLQHPDVDCVGIADPSDEARRRAAEALQVATIADYREWSGLIDAAIVAAPSQLHFSIADELLRQGTHLLIEKPMTTASWQADRLEALAAQSGALVQVGHVERFSPAWNAARSRLTQPHWIEATRHSGYSFRSTDIGVVFDLMIHDLDLVLDLVNSPIVDVQAHGATILSPDEDVAFAQVLFACGTIARFSASRCSPQAARTIRVFNDQGWSSIDFAQHTIECVEITAEARELNRRLPELSTGEKQMLRDEMFTRILPRATIKVDPSNAILEEQRDWLSAIREDRLPRVDVRAGRRAVALAESIVALIREQKQRPQQSGFTQDAPPTVPFRNAA
jgi:predicted dehydrogenase